jgi:hypothetical protein
MSEIIRGEADRVVDSQLTPTLYIQAPILEMNEDPHNFRNNGSLSGAKAEDDEDI